MKFSTASVSAFLAALASAAPSPQNVQTVTVYGNPQQTVTQASNTFTTQAAEVYDNAANADNNVLVQTVVVEKTVVVDQNGNIVTLQSPSTATAAAAETASSTASVATPNSAGAWNHIHSHSSANGVQASSTSQVYVPSSFVTLSSSAAAVPSPSTSSVVVVPSTFSTSSVVVVPTTSSTPVVVPTTTSTPVVVPTTTSSTPSSTSTAAAVASDTGSSTNLDSFASECLSTHNKYRALHSAPDLTWNSTLSDYAQNYLNGQNCVFAHSGGPYGENIAMGYSSASDAIAAWYNEEDLYDYSSGQYSSSTGHFTQIVWTSTTALGCATYDCGSSGSFLVCEYYPAGNVIGYFTENVFANKRK
ncbi:uncharacterized protein SAPINGB_P001477 [Magnusiomyces paraingens]|uniref:SCP domain-containing protein n=1 Tax=Magnusiomyces paraingens TaxID=2606893 RepID=A0A5E8BC25_9ASCO|nr:uncharacterized protein SAPINGB_P001477 [Saprochaete ingens]VVT46968.1 unnamed protein product [Saprochaete ingens]